MMPRGSLRSAILAVSMALLVTATASAENRPAPVANLPQGVEEYYPALFQLIESAGAGDSEAIVAWFEQHLATDDKPADELIPVDRRADWLAVFRALLTQKPEFESIDVVGFQPISSAACELLLVANSRRGPVLFRFGVFRHRGRWKTTAMTYTSAWEKVVSTTVAAAYTRLPQPVHHDLRAKPVASRPQNEETH